MLKFIEKIENDKAPWYHYFLVLSFFIFMRIFIEQFSTHANPKLDLILHYSTSYYFIFMALIIIISLFSKEKILKIFKLFSIGFSCIIFSPLLDLIISKGKGLPIGYLNPKYHSDLLLRFLTLGGKLDVIGITPGIKIQIFIILVVIGLYTFIKTKNIIKSFFSSLIAYIVIFGFMLVPFFIKHFFGTNRFTDNILYAKIFFIFIFIFSMIIFIIHNKTYFFLILNDLRPITVVFHYFLIIGGIFLATENIYFNSDLFLDFILILISILFAAVFSIITNNIEDRDIDELSHPNRPHITKIKNYNSYMTIAWVSFFLSLCYSMIVGGQAFLLIVLLIANYFLYSIPPIKLKNVFFISKFLISANYLIMILLGFSFFNSILEFNFIFALYVLVGFALIHHFRDIADYKGDKKAKIPTIPVVFGLRKSKQIIGILTLIVYLCSYFFIVRPLIFYIIILLSIIQFLLIIKRNYSEKIVFILTIIFIFLLFFGMINPPIKINNVQKIEISNDLNLEINNSIKRGTNYILKTIEAGIDLSCISIGGGECPVDNAGLPFASYFIVSAVSNELSDYQKSSIEKGLLDLYDGKIFRYSSSAPDDSDDTAFALKTLKILGVKNISGDFSEFYDSNTGLYKTFISSTDGSLTYKKSQINNFKAHIEVNANVFSYKNYSYMPRNYKVYLNDRITEGAITSFFYPSEYYASYFILDWICSQNIENSIRDKILRHIIGNQLEDGSWNEDVIDTEFALLSLKVCDVKNDAILNGINFLLKKQDQSGSWRYEPHLWEYRYSDEPVIDWFAYDDKNLISTSLAIMVLS